MLYLYWEKYVFYKEEICVIHQTKAIIVLKKMDVTVICRGINESLYMGCLRMFKTCFLYSRGTSEDLELFTMSCFTIKKYVL